MQLNGTSSKQVCDKYFIFPNNFMDHHSGETDEWVVELKMGITETRLLYKHINDSLYGPYPKKSIHSIDELAYLRALKNKLFAIICEYSYDMEEYDK